MVGSVAAEGESYCITCFCIYAFVISGLLGALVVWSRSDEVCLALAVFQRAACFWIAVVCTVVAVTWQTLSDACCVLNPYYAPLTHLKYLLQKPSYIYIYIYLHGFYMNSSVMSLFPPRTNANTFEHWQQKGTKTNRSEGSECASA